MQFQSDDVTEALAIALLTNHGLSHTVTAAPTAIRGPKLERPKVDVGVSLEEWNVFVRRWNVFKSGSGIEDASAASQLFQCTGPALGDSILKTDATATTKSLSDLLAAMRSLAVIPSPQECSEQTCYTCTRSMTSHFGRSQHGFVARPKRVNLKLRASVAMLSTTRTTPYATSC